MGGGGGQKENECGMRDNSISVYLYMYTCHVDFTCRQR